MSYISSYKTPYISLYKVIQNVLQYASTPFCIFFTIPVTPLMV